MALVLAIAAAVLLGTSDFFAARSARTTPAVTVTRTAVATSVVVAPLGLLVVESAWIGRDLVLAACSGLFMIGGLLLLYRGYAVARMGIVAPLSSVLLAAVPVLWDALAGVRPAPVAALGMGVGLVALVLTAYTPGGAGSVTQAAVLGITSGVSFGAAFTLMGEISADAGLSTVIVQRAVGFGLLAALAAVRSDPFFPVTASGRWYGIGAGLPAAAALMSLQVAFQKGESGQIAVASSQFATVAVLLAVVFNRERMRWWQTAGVAATAVAVALIAAGGG